MEEKKGRDLLDDDLWGDEDEDTQKDKYLTFHLGGEDYGVEIAYITQIINIQKITEVPDMPDFVKGVLNYRGNVIPVIDARTRFHMEAKEYDERTCVIVISINETEVGLLVDTVVEVLDIPEKDVDPPPQIAKGESSRYIKGLGKVEDDVKILLDVKKLLFEEELLSLEGVTVKENSSRSQVQLGNEINEENQ